MSDNTAILLLSFGTPTSKQDLVPYMTSIRRGHVPTDREIAGLTKRYDAIGQWDNVDLQTMGAQQRDVLQRLLPKESVFVAYLHVPNSMERMVETIDEQGFSKLMVLVTSPFYTLAGTGAYERKLATILANYPHLRVEFIQSWWEQPTFTEYWCEALQPYMGDHDALYIFSAHSVPEQTAGDYKEHLTQGAATIAHTMGRENWKLAFQSAPPRDGWLGPSVETVIETSLKEGAKHIVFVPFGFVSDHVEVLYDNDIECRGLVEAGGGVYDRTPMPNGNSLFIQAMASAITERLKK